MYAVYGLPSCGYCVRAKALLGDRGLRIRFHDIRNTRNRRRMQDRLRKAGVSVDPAALSVPQIFYGDTYVGGYDALRRRLGAAQPAAGGPCVGGACRWAGKPPRSAGGRRRR
jgi:glutaredoxin